MKILAAAGRETFIVEMTQDEIVKAAGFSSCYDDAWTRLNASRDVKVGTEIKVSVAYQFHARVVEHQREAASAANTLRALADLINGSLPEVVIPPVGQGAADEAEWVVWNGVDEKPDLDLETVVEVHTRDGRTETARVRKIWWKHSARDDKDFNSDIIRYRVKGGS